MCTQNEVAFLRAHCLRQKAADLQARSTDDLSRLRVEALNAEAALLEARASHASLPASQSTGRSGALRESRQVSSHA